MAGKILGVGAKGGAAGAAGGGGGGTVTILAPTAAPAGSLKAVSTKDAAGSGGGGGGSSASRAAAAAKSAAQNRYRDQANTLQQQADALTQMLTSGFKQALDIRLSNINRTAKIADETLMQGYSSRLGGLRENAEDNENALADGSYGNSANRARERSNALAEALSLGAGESDVLRSQMMSLRSWDNNQDGINRSFRDSLTSINSSLNDLNADTLTGRMNAAQQANADRDAAYTSFYNQQSEAYTQLGNLYGQQSELYGLAKESGSTASDADRVSKDSASRNAFNMAAANASSAYVNSGVDDTIKNWKGEEEFEGGSTTNVLAGAPTTTPERKKPEGATLRKW